MSKNITKNLINKKFKQKDNNLRIPSLKLDKDGTENIPLSKNSIINRDQNELVKSVFNKRIVNDRLSSISYSVDMKEKKKKETFNEFFGQMVDNYLIRYDTKQTFKINFLEYHNLPFKNLIPDTYGLIIYIIFGAWIHRYLFTSLGLDFFILNIN